MTDENWIRKAKIFFDRKTIVHVKLKDGFFYNGLIMEIADNFFVIKDNVVGDKFILFDELEKEMEIFIPSDKSWGAKDEKVY